VTWVTLPALSRYLPSTTATSLRCRRSCPLIVRWAARKAAVWGIPSPLSPHLPFPFFSSPQRLRLGHRPKSLRRGRIRSGEAPICVVVVQIYALLARLGRLRWGLSVLGSGRADGDGGVGEVGLRKHRPRPPALAPSVCLRLRSGGTALRCTGH
jgi:hypothetical protein